MINCKCNTNYLSYEQMIKSYFFKDINKKDIINEQKRWGIKEDKYLKEEMNNLLNKIRQNRDQYLK